MNNHNLGNLNRTARVLTCGALVFLGSLLLGVTYLPTVGYFWSLALGRILFAVLFVFAPETNAGRSKPLLVLFGLATLACDILAGPDSSWLFLAAYYLFLEVTVDSLVVEHATEQEAPLELGWLAAFRLGGLWLGLVLGFSQDLFPVATSDLVRGTLALVTLFWILCREKRDDKLFPTALRTSSIPPRTVLEFALHYLRTPFAVGAIVNLLVVSTLAGCTASAVLPYPLLHPEMANNWLVDVFKNLQVLGLGLFLVWLCERLRLPVQLHLSTLAVALILLTHQFGQTLSWPYPAWGVLLANILLSCRPILREAHRVPPLLKGALVVSVWAMGSLIGLALAQTVESRWLTWPLLFLSIAFSLWSYRRYAAAAKPIGSLAPPRHSERYGDRNLDFEAAPASTPRKKSRHLDRLFHLVFVNFPVTILLSTTMAATLTFGWYLFDEKKNFQRRVETAVKIFRTELFLNAFCRRLYQDMLASHRVPQDLGAFIAQSFTYEGEPMDSRDAWGTPYRFSQSKSKVVISSAGPDKKFGTDDDRERETPKPPGTKG